VIIILNSQNNVGKMQAVLNVKAAGIYLPLCFKALIHVRHGTKSGGRYPPSASTFVNQEKKNRRQTKDMTITQ
jgi:hypothetical protein